MEDSAATNQIIITLVCVFIVRWLIKRYVLPRLDRLPVDVSSAAHGPPSRLRVTEINVFPIKSCAALSGKRASWIIGAHGLKHDREYMLIDASDNFISQRQKPRLALVQPSLKDRGDDEDVDLNEHDNALHIVVCAPGMVEDLELPLHRSSDVSASSGASVVTARLWGNDVEGEEYTEGSKWFSEFLDCPVRLIRQLEKPTRRVADQYALAGATNTMGFPDGFPVHVITQESLDGLNRELEARSEQAVPMSRFRPNLVISGAFYPNEEDEWSQMRIGRVLFSNQKPCTRCKQTTVNGDTGEFEQSGQPLALLKELRKPSAPVYKSKPLFGVNWVHKIADGKSSSKISVGDSMKILATQERYGFVGEAKGALGHEKN